MPPTRAKRECKGTTTERLFTTYQREAQSGNDYAIHRYHASSLGRFTTADPVHGASAAPQQLNRYAYVGGDPVNRRDPRGLYVRRDCSSFELPLGQSCAILPQTDKGGGGGSPMDIPWGPGGAEPPLPGLLPGGGFGYSGVGNPGYAGPAGPASSGGPMGGGWGSGLFDGPGDDENPWDYCTRTVYAPCVQIARETRSSCRGDALAAAAFDSGLCLILDMTGVGLPAGIGCEVLAGMVLGANLYFCSKQYDSMMEGCENRRRDCVQANSSGS